MKRLLMVFGCFLLFAPNAKAEFRAMEDYSFAGDCQPEIVQYCSNIDYDLGDCMLLYQSELSVGCLSAVRAFDADRWNHPEHRDRISPREREDFRDLRREEEMRRDEMRGREEEMRRGRGGFGEEIPHRR